MILPTHFNTPRSKITITYNGWVYVDRQSPRGTVRYTFREGPPETFEEAIRIARFALRYLRNSYVPGVLL